MKVTDFCVDEKYFFILKCGISTVITDKIKMKIRKLMFSLALFGTIALKVNAQTPSIPNGNFESWTNINYEIPENYLWSSNADAFRSGQPFNVLRSTDAYHGNFAVQMKTEISKGDTLPGIFVSVYPNNNNPALWHGGFPYNQQASGMRGFYKSSISSPDTGFVIAFFFKGGVMIGQYGYYFYGTHNTYTPFSFSFLPALPMAPDTIIFGAGSSNFSNQNYMRNGSMLILDSISFTGVATQPSLLNGDFEFWKTTTIDKPNYWFFNGGGSNNLMGGAYKTNDAKAGFQAIELITFIGERNNNPVAQAGRISTGWYPKNCEGGCEEQGGFPFTNQVDTLAFWYKFTPSGNTEADIQLNFKKNGHNIGNAGRNPISSLTYQYMEIPFNLEQVPDTVIIDLQSSQWQDSSLSVVGSSLKIDEIHFKSQRLTTGLLNYQIQNNTSIYPNPAIDNLTISNIENNGKQIELYIFNTFGQQVFLQQFPDKIETTTINVSDFNKGVYFLRMTSSNQLLYDKKIIIIR